MTTMFQPEAATTIELHRYLGAHALSDSQTRFCVWSPTSERVLVDLIDQDRTVPLKPLAGGYHAIEVDDVGPGQRYCFRFDRPVEPPTKALPDPVSRFQPEGVHGPSEVVDPRKYSWRDTDWTGPSHDTMVLYELHIGAFTEEGTFSAAIARLDELVDLGITAIELMPVADAAGRWNWGYDGVCLFAPNRNYGTPDDLRRLVDEAHCRGLGVILDVVYNHLGPEGNYLGQAGPYLSPHHTTVWGAAPNFDGSEYARELRRIFIANAIHWFDEYHFDGLRIDAIHCMLDDSDPHIVTELGHAAEEWSRTTGRPAKLIAESNVYDPHLLTPTSEGGCGFEAEWCDDFLHSVFAVVRPGEQLCHRVYFPGPDLDQTLKFGFVYEGTLQHQRGRCQPSARVDTSGLIYSIQHHDFIGNHPLGRRLHQLTSVDTQRAAAALLLLSPAIPMLFMGEEFACEHPFQFFVDFNDDHLLQSVVEGRQREYPQHDWSSGALPTDPNAFYASKIGIAADGNLEMRHWYKDLLAIRHQWKADGLIHDDHISVTNQLDVGLFRLSYTDRKSTGTVIARLSANTAADETCSFHAPGRLILDSRNGSTGDDQIAPNHAKVFFDQGS